MFLLQCPKCKNRMKYQGTSLILTKKRKRCVYCGYSFSVGSGIVKEY